MTPQERARLRQEINKLRLEEEKELIEYEKLLIEEQYHQSEDSLYKFFINAWSCIDAQPYVDSWHIECICEHAQAAVERTESSLRRMIINIPPRHCLSEGTYISMNDGTYKPIKDVSIGDKVYSFNGTKVVEDTVIDKVYTGTQIVYRLILEDGNCIEGTKEHRLWCNGNYVEINNIKIGDNLLSIDLLDVRVIDKVVKPPCITYDIETLHNHNFFANTVLSHNSKSTILSIALPTWRWIKAPQEKFITASYSERLYLQNSVSSRRLINHPWYSNRWIGEGPGRYTINKDSNQKHRIDNNKYGYRVATSPGGMGMGLGYSVCIIDDPLDGKDAQSDIERNKVNDWYTGTILNRADDPNSDVIIVVAQRLHEDDLPGFLLEQGGYFHLNIPEEFERQYTFMSPIGFNDVRQREGELICPDRFDPDFIETQKKKPFDYAAKYQQRPVPLGGGIVKREWIQYYDVRPDQFEIVISSFDLSMVSSTTADFTVGTVWGKQDNKYYLLDMIRDRMDVISQIQAIQYIYNKYPECRATLIEAKANGPAVIKMLEKEIPNIIPIEPKDFGGNKEARLNACVPEFVSKSVYLPANSDQTNIILTELLSFPRGRYDDIVDSVSQALNWLILNHRSYSAIVPVAPTGVSSRSSIYEIMGDRSQTNMTKQSLRKLWM